MKLALLLIFLSVNAFSFVDNVDNQKILPDNLTVNGGAEQGTKLWTESGGGTLTTDTSNKVDGNKAIKFTYSDAGDYIKSESVTPKTDGICEALFLYKTASTAIDWAVYDGSGNQISDTMSNIAASSSKFSETKVLFTCSTASTYHVRVTGGANTEIIYVDNLYIGKTKNIGTIAQSYNVGSITWTPTTGCYWQRNSGDGSFSNNTICGDNTRTVIGDITDSSAGQRPEFTLKTKPGHYRVTLSGDLRCVATESQSGGRCDFKLYDTATLGPIESMRYGAAASVYNGVGITNMTFDFDETSSNTRVINVHAYVSTGTGAVIEVYYSNFKISVDYYPASSQQVQTADTSAQSWSGHFGTSCSHAVSSSTYTAITDATSCDLVEDSNKNFGTVTKYGDVLGFTFTPKQAPAKYLVCAWSSAYSANSSTVNNRITSNGTTAIAENNFMVGSTYVYSGMNGCGILDVSSVTATNVWIETKSTTGTTTIDNNQGPEATVKYSIVNISQPLPQPTYNSIITKRAGVDRTIRGTVNANGSIEKAGSGDWSSAKASTGKYNITFSPAFPSTDYQCTCTVGDRPRLCGIGDTESARTASTIQFSVTNTASGSDTIDNNFDFICTGAN